MLPNGVTGTGISAHKRAHDLSDFGDELDMIEDLGVESIEIPTFDMDLVVGGRVRRPQLKALARACAGRDIGYSVHGPLAINFMDAAWRLPRHFEVLLASMEVAAEIGAENYVLHSGLIVSQQSDAVEAGYMRQREWLSKAGEAARDLGLTICVETLFGGFRGEEQTASPARLATELAAIAHPNVMATIDFSHSYIKLDYDGQRDEFVSQMGRLAPFARHLHIHDSFGRQDDIWVYSEGERLAFGHGDLHLPVGWGDIPWATLMAECVFAPGVLFNIELNQRYWYAAQECVDATKELAVAARVDKRERTA
ncbi:MAG: TIM barrel protein [Rhizobiaceae bacterium]|nr:TIM barrel protein [Rhizobiaceae bacterium]